MEGDLAEGSLTGCEYRKAMGQVARLAPTLACRVSGHVVDHSLSSRGLGGPRLVRHRIDCESLAARGEPCLEQHSIPGQALGSGAPLDKAGSSVSMAAARY